MATGVRKKTFHLIKDLFIQLIVLTISAVPLKGETHHVGPGKTFTNPEQAAAVAEPGDTILIYPGNWDRTYFIESLEGTANHWIVIRGIGEGETVMGGGTESLHFINCSWVILENLIFERNTGNGVNIDDGGDYSTPTHHFIIRGCTFRNMNASGNNDFLKLSGLDSFEVTDCLFANGAAGGSGIDMVGCHWGMISDNTFHDLGSNSIQAKGGTRYITITRNYFEDGGMRAMNLGGSTGLDFFRPLGVNYEAQDLEVYANVTMGSDAPVAFVSSQNVRVWNNTFYLPDRWAIRILQESGDTSFFQPSSFGEFINNLIVVDNDLRTSVNVGPFTRPETFRFSNNLWWHVNDPGYAPLLPVIDPQQITGLDPMMIDPQGGDFSLSPGSPAIGKGRVLFRNFIDYLGKTYSDPPSIGAIEGGVSTFSFKENDPIAYRIFPNPVKERLSVLGQGPWVSVKIYDVAGGLIKIEKNDFSFLDISDLDRGVYFLVLENKTGIFSHAFVKL
jgi:hypothetical protein